VQTHILRSLPEIEALSSEWRELLAESISNVPFLTPEFIAAWWRHMGGGEWQAAELYVIAMREEDGKLVGIAPLFYAKNKQGQNALQFIGTVEIADFLDFVVRPEDLHRFLDCLFYHLNGPDAPVWDVLDLYNILDESPSSKALEAAAAGAGWRFEQDVLQPSPYIPLPESFEQYLEGLQGRYRKELRRKARQAANYFIPVSWYIVEDPDSLDENLDALLALMSKEPEKARFLTEPMRAQMRAIAQAAFDNGWLNLSMVDVGRDKAAAFIAFDYDNRIWGYNSGYDPAVADISPGQFLLWQNINWAIEQGREAFDFMRGDEEWKYQLGSVDRYVMHVAVRRN
jgi:CelD/BcsL family acetyltransferase involved in cellulose biosynthesis